MSAYTTAIASEFYILSILHRLGLNATLTLGNKKAIDIVVIGDAGKAVTIDVKGAVGPAFFVDNQVNNTDPKHFVVFVTYLNKFGDLNTIPEIYVVPSRDIVKLHRKAPGGKNVVALTKLKEHDPPYRDGWESIRRALQND
jgi:hypothetical protein